MVVLAIHAIHGVKIKDSKKKDCYLDLAKELKSGNMEYIVGGRSQGDLKVPFLLDTTRRCRRERYSIPWIASLYP